MFLLPASTPGHPEDLIVSASDVVQAAGCGYSVLRALDVLLGRVAAPEPAPDAFKDLILAKGEQHERRVLAALQGTAGDRIYEVAQPAAKPDRGLLQLKHSETLAALAGGYDVVYQASFFDGAFHGKADFLIREPDGTWSVNDSKLARNAKTEALLQLGAYADQLQRAGVPVHDSAHLILGTNETSAHPVDRLIEDYRAARDRLTRLLQAHRDSGAPAQWKNGAAGCLKTACPDCLEQLTAHDDLMLVRGMNRSRRTKLHTAGIRTLAAFAASAPDEKADAMQLRLLEQARMQAGTAEVDGAADGVTFRVVRPEILAALPDPDPGDVFFDFEGDPNWQEPDTGEWGIEYLFGLLERPLEDPGAPEAFVPFTAHDRDQEREALTAFMDHLAERLLARPQLHVYHYAHYEVTALRNLAKRHGILADQVEELVGAGVFVDLLETVKKAIITNGRSLGLKKLEPLYMEASRTGVATAVESMTQYHDYCLAAQGGDTETAAAIMQDILDYNEYDCLSTLRMRDWLLGLRCQP